jgi:hypothetical protein
MTPPATAELSTARKWAITFSVMLVTVMQIVEGLPSAVEQRDPEERHGCPGARRALGGGGPCRGPPRDQ